MLSQTHIRNAYRSVPRLEPADHTGDRALFAPQPAVAAVQKEATEGKPVAAQALLGLLQPERTDSRNSDKPVHSNEHVQRNAGIAWFPQ